MRPFRRVGEMLRRLRAAYGRPDTARLVRNGAFGAADQILQPVLWFLTAPLFVARLGIDQYGIWMLANTILGLSSIMLIGLGDATVAYVAKYRARGEPDGVERVIRATMTVNGALSVIAGSCLFLVAGPLVHSVFSVPSAEQNLAAGVLRLAAVGLTFRLLDAVVQAAIHGHERYDITARIAMVISTITLLSAACLVSFGFGLREIIATSVLLSGIGLACKTVYLTRWLVPNLRISPTLSISAIREVGSFAFYSWIQGLSGLLLNQLDRLLVAGLMGTAALGYYSICLQVAQQIHSIPARAAAALFPLSAGVRESGDASRLRHIYYKGYAVTCALACMLGLPVFVFAHSLLRAWVGEDTALHATPMLRVLAFVFTLLATSIVPFYFLNGVGFVRLNATFGLLSGGMVALAATMLIPVLGPVGAAWSRSVNLPISLIARAILHFRVLDDRRWYAVLTSFAPVLLPFAVASGALSAADGLVLRLWELALIGGTIGAAGAGLVLITARYSLFPRTVSPA